MILWTNRTKTNKVKHNYSSKVLNLEFGLLELRFLINSNLLGNSDLFIRLGYKDYLKCKEDSCSQQFSLLQTVEPLSRWRWVYGTHHKTATPEHKSERFQRRLTVQIFLSPKYTFDSNWLKISKHGTCLKKGREGILTFNIDLSNCHKWIKVGLIAGFMGKKKTVNNEHLAFFFFFLS